MSSSDELVDGERQGAMALGAVATVILGAEGDAAFVERDQPTVRDGDPVGVAQIGEHGLWAGEGRLGEDDPLLPPDGRQVVEEGAPVAQSAMVAQDVKPAGGVHLDQPRQRMAMSSSMPCRRGLMACRCRARSRNAPSPAVTSAQSCRVTQRLARAFKPLDRRKTFKVRTDEGGAPGGAKFAIRLAA